MGEFWLVLAGTMITIDVTSNAGDRYAGGETVD